MLVALIAMNAWLSMVSILLADVHFALVLGVEVLVVIETMYFVNEHVAGVYCDRDVLMFLHLLALSCSDCFDVFLTVAFFDILSDLDFHFCFLCALCLAGDCAIGPWAGV